MFVTLIEQHTGNHTSTSRTKTKMCWKELLIEVSKVNRFTYAQPVFTFIMASGPQKHETVRQVKDNGRHNGHVHRRRWFDLPRWPVDGVEKPENSRAIRMLPRPDLDLLSILIDRTRFLFARHSAAGKLAAAVLTLFGYQERGLALHVSSGGGELVPREPT